MLMTDAIIAVGYRVNSKRTTRFQRDNICKLVIDLSEIFRQFQMYSYKEVFHGSF